MRGRSIALKDLNSEGLIRLICQICRIRPIRPIRLRYSSRPW